MKREKFKAEIKDLMINKKKAHKRQKMLNFGLAKPIRLDPPGIYER